MQPGVSAQSIEHTSRIALQCGGSDAFSGVSGNPLARLGGEETIRYGGSANLAETDELIGGRAVCCRTSVMWPRPASSLRTLERFQEQVSWHGHDAEGNQAAATIFAGFTTSPSNPSAPPEKDPEVRLDYSSSSMASGWERPVFISWTAGQRPGRHRRPSRFGLQSDSLYDRQWVDHEFPVRAHDQNHDQHRSRSVLREMASHPSHQESDKKQHSNAVSFRLATVLVCPRACVSIYW